MLNLKVSKTIVIGSTLLFVTACTISYRTCHDTAVSLQENPLPVISIPQVQQILLNKHMVKYVPHYIHCNIESLSKIKLNSVSSFKVMDAVFKKYRLPVELKYLAVIESELKATAVSKVGASGPWQLMPATATALGLTVNPDYDERTQYKKSTKAAALYLRDLHMQFDDWLLVLAAYNCGPGPVNNAIKKSGSRNFWKLQNYLPAESREHVKRFIATQYYFEGKGSVTTLTKQENLEYNQGMALLTPPDVRSMPVKHAFPGLIYPTSVQKSTAYNF